MALDRAPNPPREGVTFTDRNGLLTPAGLELLNQMWRQIAAGYVIVPCQASGTNAITLTPILHQEGAKTLANHMTFSFEAVATSSGLITMRVGALTFLKAYTGNGATQATTGDVVDNRLYHASYLSTLDGGAGGFSLK